MNYLSKVFKNLTLSLASLLFLIRFFTVSLNFSIEGLAILLKSSSSHNYIFSINSFTFGFCNSYISILNTAAFSLQYSITLIENSEFNFFYLSISKTFLILSVHLLTHFLYSSALVNVISLLSSKPRFVGISIFCEPKI